jgi:cullin 1
MAKNATAMPVLPGKDDIQGTWDFLAIGVEKIMNHLRDGIDLKTYMSLYTAIHNFCTAQKAVGQTTNLNATHRGGKSHTTFPALHARAS